MPGQDNERQRIEALFDRLNARRLIPFPQPRQSLKAPRSQGVYVIRDRARRVVHVGRSLRGKEGLFQRLRNHLNAQSSFVKVHLKGNGKKLRDGYTFQCIVEENDRKRALLEHFATAWHCPVHLGVGRKKGAK